MAEDGLPPVGHYLVTADKFVEMVEEIKELRSTVSKIMSKLDGPHAPKLDGQNDVSKSSNDKKDGDNIGKPAGESTPIVSSVNNHSESPFISPDGGLVIWSHNSTVKRKLEMDEEEPAISDESVDIDSFSARNVRFNKPQFPPGLVTMKDVKEDTNKEDKKDTNEVEKKSNSPPLSAKSPTSKPQCKRKSKSNKSVAHVADDENPSEKGTEKRTSRMQSCPNSVENKGKANSSKTKGKKKSNSNAEQDEGPEKGCKSMDEIDKMLSELANSLKPKTRKKRNSKVKTVEGRENVQNDVFYSNDMEEVTITKSTKSRERICKKYWEDPSPNAIFYNYIPCLSPRDKQICINIVNGGKFDCLYSPPELAHKLSVGESWCIFPDGWLSDQFLNVFLYDMHLGLIKTSSNNKMILPTTFQGVVFNSDEKLNPYMLTFGVLNWCAKHTATFVPHVLKNIEEVFIPVLDQVAKHWFLLVFHVLKKKVYIVDSLGTSEDRYKLSTKLMSNAGPELLRNRLGQLFKDSCAFSYEVVHVKHQPNCHDCGMYVLKYIECADINSMKDISYSTDEMRVERLKYLARLVASEHNDPEYRDRFIGDGCS